MPRKTIGVVGVRDDPLRRQYAVCMSPDGMLLESAQTGNFYVMSLEALIELARAAGIDVPQIEITQTMPDAPAPEERQAKKLILGT